MSTRESTDKSLPLRDPLTGKGATLAEGVEQLGVDLGNISLMLTDTARDIVALKEMIVAGRKINAETAAKFCHFVKYAEDRFSAFSGNAHWLLALIVGIQAGNTEPHTTTNGETLAEIIKEMRQRIADAVERINARTPEDQASSRDPSNGVEACAGGTRTRPGYTGECPNRDRPTDSQASAEKCDRTSPDHPYDDRHPSCDHDLGGGD